MITPWTIYWIGIIDSLKDVLFLVGLVSLLCSAVLIASISIFTSERKEELKQMALFALKIVAPLCLFSFLASAFIPSTRVAAAMYVVPAIVNNEDMQAIGGNSLKALRKLSEEWLLELDDIDGEDKKGKKEADI